MIVQIAIKVIVIFFILNIQNFVFSETLFDNDNCNWGNNNFPCIQITKQIPNTSEFTKEKINKIIITKKQIDDMGAIDLIDVLKTIPNINITQSGPRGQQASLFMQGTGSNHVLVMINGIPINDQSTTQGLHDFGVDFIQTIQQIEIFPGPNASNFGTNAIGGAINLVLNPDYVDKISFEGDKEKNYQISSNKSYIYDNSSLNIKFGTIKNETISVTGNKSDEKDKVINYSTNINYENFLKPNLRFYNTNYIRQTLSEYDGSSTNQIGFDSDNRMATFQLGIDNFKKNRNENYGIYYTIYNRQYDENGTIDKYESEVLGIKYDFTKTLGQEISYGFGSEYKYDWGYFDNQGSYTASTKGNVDNISVYSNIGMNIFPSTNISLFLRNDEHKQAGNNSSYKINLSQKIKNIDIGLTRMTGLRNPTLYELYGTDNYGYSGNKNLKAEKSISDEIYFKYNYKSNIKFVTNIFRTGIKNNIEYLSNKYVNDSDNVDLNQSGINSNISYRNNNYYLGLFGSLLSSEKEDGSTQLRRPEKTYGFNFNNKIYNKFLKEINLNISYNHYGKHFDTHSVNYNTIEMDSTDIINLKVSKKINENEFFLKVTNLFNENYQRPHGYNQEGRFFRFGLRY